MTTHKLLVFWGNEGLESVFDLTDWERRKMWCILKDEPEVRPPSLKLMMLRAQANVQRECEIYIIETEDIPLEEMRELFNDSETAQMVVDLIREKGTKLYSDYKPSRRTIR